MIKLLDILKESLNEDYLNLMEPPNDGLFVYDEHLGLAIEPLTTSTQLLWTQLC